MAGFLRDVKIGICFAGGVLLGFGFLLKIPWGWVLVHVPRVHGIGMILFDLATSFPGFFLGGWLAGASLGRGKRAAVAFGLAFAVMLPFLAFPIIGIQGLGGGEHALRLLAHFGGPALAGFGILGGLGVALAGEPWRTVAAGAITFATSGAVGGVLLTMALTAHTLIHAGIIAYFLVPAALGGVALAHLIPRRE